MFVTQFRDPGSGLREHGRVRLHLPHEPSIEPSSGDANGDGRFRRRRGYARLLQASRSEHLQGLQGRTAMPPLHELAILRFRPGVSSPGDSASRLAPACSAVHSFVRPIECLATASLVLSSRFAECRAAADLPQHACPVSCVARMRHANSNGVRTCMHSHLLLCGGLWLLAL